MGTLLPSSARPARRTSRRPHNDLADVALERARTENSALRQRLTEQSRQLRHTKLLLDATRAENAVMRQNIVDLRQAQATWEVVRPVVAAEALA